MLARTRITRVLAAMSISLTLATTALIGSAGVANALLRPYELAIDAPGSVLVGQGFAVRVETRAVGGGVDPACTAPVTLSAEGPAGSSPWVGTVDAFTGVASFDVTLGSAGSWTLTASAPDGECGATFRPGTHLLTASASIPPGQPIAPCPNGRTCEQTWNGGDTAATLIARSGSFTVARFVPNSELSCNAGHLEDNSVLEFDHDGSVRKRIIIGLERSLIDKPLWRHRVCWEGDRAFIPRGGGQPVKKGLLRNCRRGVPAPCVLSKRWVKGGALIIVLAPPGDPKAYIR